MPDYEVLQNNTFAAFGDLDASPTKAWIITNREKSPEFFQYAVGRNPEYELYDIKRDPHCTVNLVDSAASAKSGPNCTSV